MRALQPGGEVRAVGGPSLADRRAGRRRFCDGHYCQVFRSSETGRYSLRKALDPLKDQTYFLCMLSQEQLSRVIFPLGTLAKAEVRRIAAGGGSLHARQAGEPGLRRRRLPRGPRGEGERRPDRRPGRERDRIASRDLGIHHRTEKGTRRRRRRAAVRDSDRCRHEHHCRRPRVTAVQEPVDGAIRELGEQGQAGAAHQGRRKDPLS